MNKEPAYKMIDREIQKIKNRISKGTVVKLRSDSSEFDTEAAPLTREKENRLGRQVVVRKVRYRQFVTTEGSTFPISMIEGVLGEVDDLTHHVLVPIHGIKSKLRELYKREGFWNEGKVHEYFGFFDRSFIDDLKKEIEEESEFKRLKKGDSCTIVGQNDEPIAVINAGRDHELMVSNEYDPYVTYEGECALIRFKRRDDNEKNE